jgi:hypothetical protein
MAVRGLDIGTGGSRAVIVIDAGRVLAASTEVHAPFDSPETGWAEQNPANWWRVAQLAIRAVLATGPVTAAEVHAVGLSGQRCSTRLDVCVPRAPKPCGSAHAAGRAMVRRLQPDDGRVGKNVGCDLSWQSVVEMSHLRETAAQYDDVWIDDVHETAKGAR